MASLAPIAPHGLPATVFEVKSLSPDRAARRARLIATLLESIAVPENAANLELAHLGTYFAFKPRNAWDNWLSGQIALLTFRIERNQRIERRVRDLAALRAIDCWEVDQALLAERTAARLATHPAEALATLWTTLAGCDWLIARWRDLDTGDIGGWTTEQRDLARRIYPGEFVDLSRPGALADHRAHLLEQRERMVEVDQVERALVEADLADHLGPAIRAVRRDGRALERRMQWCLTELRTPLPDRIDRPLFYPKFVSAPTASEPAAPADQPQPTVTGDTAETRPVESTDFSQTNPLFAPTPAGEDAQMETDQQLASDPSARLRVPIAGHHRRIDPATELARQRRAERRHRA